MDLARLARSTPTSASHVGLFIMGSSNQYDLCSDLSKFAKLAAIDRAPWEQRSDSWDNPHAPGYRYGIWLWMCPRAVLSDWWQQVHECY